MVRSWQSKGWGVKIYTRTGDDGTTGMLFGGRLPKDAPRVMLNGAIDETQALIGLVRAAAGEGELAGVCTGLARDLWILMAEVATLPENRRKLKAGKTLVDTAMVEELERLIDGFSERFETPRDFVVPGQSLISAHLDHARTVARRAERLSVAFTRETPGSQVQIYLNRLSDLLWSLARWQDETILRFKEV